MFDPGQEDPRSSVLAWRIPGTGSLVGCRLWGRTESDMTEAMQQQQEDPLEKGLATLCSLLAWRISWTEEPSRQHSMGSQRVRYD